MEGLQFEHLALPVVAGPHEGPGIRLDLQQWHTHPLHGRKARRKGIGARGAECFRNFPEAAVLDILQWDT